MRRLRKYFTGVVQGLSGNKSFLVRFQDGCEKVMNLNQPTAVILEKILVTEEYEVPRISEKQNEKFRLEKGCYIVCFCVV